MIEASYRIREAGPADIPELVLLIRRSFLDVARTTPPFLRGQYPRPPEEVEGHLPKHGIHGIPDHFGEPGPMGVMRYLQRDYAMSVPDLADEKMKAEMASRKGEAK